MYPHVAPNHSPLFAHEVQRRVCQVASGDMAMRRFVALVNNTPCTLKTLDGGQVAALNLQCSDIYSRTSMDSFI